MECLWDVKKVELPFQHEVVNVNFVFIYGFSWVERDQIYIFVVQPIVWKWPFQPDTGRIQKGSKWEIQASTGRIQKGSKWEIQACGTEKEEGKKEGVYHALREWLGAQIALLILDSSFFYNWLYH